MKRALALGLLFLVAAVTPVIAGEVFVPHASNRTLGAATYRTKVWVTNTGLAPRRFSTLFIENGTDGNQLPDPDPAASTAINGGVSAVLSTVAPDGKLGMLEILGAPQLVTTARIEALDANGNLLSTANIPVVSQVNAAAAKTVLDLQGLERTADGAASDFFVMNLSRQAAICTVSAYRANSSQIAQTAVLNLLPLSQRTFTDALNTLGEKLIADTHFQVTCDQQFYAYAIAFKSGGPQTSFIPPSAALVGDLVPGSGSGGSTSGSSGGGNTSGSVVFTQPGTFLNARDGNSYIGYDLPVKPGVPYQRATIDFDLRTARFPDLLFTGVTSFRRPHEDRNQRILYYGIQIVNRNSKTTLDLGIQDVLVKTDGPWAPNHNYHLALVYDVPSRTVSMDVSENGQVVYNISGEAQHLDLSALDADHPLLVDFGQDGVADGAYAPPIGWSFANLRVVLTPQ